MRQNPYDAITIKATTVCFKQRQFGDWIALTKITNYIINRAA